MAKRKAEQANETRPDQGNPIGMVLIMGCRCRCGHEWAPHGAERPRVCPKCKSANWDQPKKWERKTSDQS